MQRPARNTPRAHHLAVQAGGGTQTNRWLPLQCPGPQGPPGSVACTTESAVAGWQGGLGWHPRLLEWHVRHVSAPRPPGSSQLCPQQHKASSPVHAASTAAPDHVGTLASGARTGWVIQLSGCDNQCVPTSCLRGVCKGPACCALLRPWPPISPHRGGCNSRIPFARLHDAAALGIGAGGVQPGQARAGGVSAARLAGQGCVLGGHVRPEC